MRADEDERAREKKRKDDNIPESAFKPLTNTELASIMNDMSEERTEPVWSPLFESFLQGRFPAAHAIATMSASGARPRDRASAHRARVHG